MSPLKDAMPEILVSGETSRMIKRMGARREAPRATARRSVADMLSQLYDIAGGMLDELNETDAPLNKRLTMAKDVAKLLPLLDRAERKAKAYHKGKAVEDMTDGELAKAYREIRVLRGPKEG